MLTIRKWTELSLEGTPWDAIFIPGQEISEGVYEYYLEALPPALWLTRGFLCGEAASHNSENIAVYSAFIKRGDRYYYVGNMTKQEFYLAFGGIPRG